MKKILVAAGLAGAIALPACSAHGSSPFVPSAAAPSAAAPIAATAPAGYAATATGRFAPSGATDGGRVSESTPMTVRVVMQLRNLPALRSLISSHQVISRGQFVARFAPSSDRVQKISNYLRSQGFSGVRAEPNGLILSATGRAAQAERAFHTTIHSFVRNGVRQYGNVTPAYVPKEFGADVASVLGLNDAPAFVLPPKQTSKLNGAPAPRPQATQSPSPCSLAGLEIIGLPSPEPEPDPSLGCLRNYYPADFQRAYDVGSVPAAKRVSIAIMAEGNVTQSISDLRVNEQNDLLAQVPVVVKAVGVPSSDTSGDDEWTLDMLASSGMAGQVKTIYLYDATSLTDSDITLEYSHWVSDDLAPIGNSSFGGCEVDSYLDGSMVAIDELLNEGAAQGQTMFASSGDTGAFCPAAGVGENGVPAGVPMVNYPASSPYAVAVGGTTLVTMSDGSYQGEVSWYSGGGGLSQFEYAPSWEASAQPVAQNGESDRGVPDVAMDGDLQTGMNIYLADDGWTIIGGTSLSSPLAAGAWARIEQSHGDLYAPPLLYANYAANKAGSIVTGPPPWEPYGAFHDILAGANGTYTALPGYDYTTGLGSFDVTLLNGQI